jgi:hypothetical protein
MSKNINISIKQLYNIIKRFHERFYERRSNSKIKYNPNELPLLLDLNIEQVYTINCLYVGVEMEKVDNRRNLVVKYRLNKGDIIISLNVLYDEYKDLLV